MEHTKHKHTKEDLEQESILLFISMLQEKQEFVIQNLTDMESDLIKHSNYIIPVLDP